MPNHELRPPAPRVPPDFDPPDFDEPWRVGPSPSPGARRRRRLLVPALSVAAVAAGAGVLYIASPPDAPATQHPARTPDSLLNKDRPPPGPALTRPGSPAAPDRRPGRDPRSPSADASAQDGRTPAARPQAPARGSDTGTGDGDGRAREQHRGDPPPRRDRTRRPPASDRAPAWIERECRRRYPHDATRRDACTKVLRHQFGH